MRYGALEDETNAHADEIAITRGAKGPVGLCMVDHVMPPKGLSVDQVGKAKRFIYTLFAIGPVEEMSKFIAWLLVRPHAQISAPAVLTVSSVCQQLVYGGFIAVMGGLFLFGQSGSRTYSWAATILILTRLNAARQIFSRFMLRSFFYL